MMSYAKGMICAPQPESVEAGADVLRAGGTAVDAAICCAFVQSVVDPLMNGIAGFGSMGIHMRTTARTRYIDFHATAPLAARPDMWLSLLEGESRDGFGFLLKGHVNELGYQSISVPGSLKAFGQAHRQYGKLPWRDLLSPAIDICRRGWLVRPHVEEFWSMGADLGHAAHTQRLAFSKTGRELYCNADGTPKRVGQLIRNTDYATTLELIAKEGADTLYRGALADAVVQDMQRNGGLITLEDLSSYQVTDNEVLAGSYRGHDILTNRPPGGGAMLIQMLNLLEKFDLRGLGHNTVEYIRTLVEVQKYATLDKDRYLGDPRFVDVPLDKFMDKKVADERFLKILSGHKVHVPRLNDGTPSKDTTHVSVVDREGNAVSMTHSLGMPSGVITDGLGFMYNGCMAAFDPRPGRATSIAPGKSRFSSMCPSFLFKDGALTMVIGAPGATQIAMGVLEVILNVLEFDMSMTEAVSVPRFSATSDIIDLSYKIPYRSVVALEQLGYQTLRDARKYGFASVHGIRVTEKGRLQGGADPNHDGVWAQG